MSQAHRIGEIEEYIRKLGEVLSVLYRKMSDTESKIRTVESDLAGLKAEIGTLRIRSMVPDETVVSREEYERFTTGLVEALKSILLEEQEQSKA